MGWVWKFPIHAKPVPIYLFYFLNGTKNIFDVFKVSQPLKYEFSIIKIEFPIYVVKAPASMMQS